MNSEAEYNYDLSTSEQTTVLPPYNEILNALNIKFKDCPDVIRKNITLQENKQAVALYIQSTVNLELVQKNFFNPILYADTARLNDKNYIQSLPIETVIYYTDINIIIAEILQGRTVIIIDGINFAIGCNITKRTNRDISEPETEKVIKGAHIGFIEDIDTNVSLLRKRFKNTTLKFKEIKLGTTTNQKVLIAYIDGIANDDILNKLYEKIKKIDFDGLIGIGYIEQLITDFPMSPFPQYLTTERVDKAVASLLEGRFVILLDDTPTTLITPVSYFSFFQTLDDFNSHWIIASFLGLIRELGMLLAVFLPALYIAVVSYHYYMIPLDLLTQLARARARIPFPPIMEALIMEITIELIREAAIRLPTYLGTTIGIVGGLVIGQAAVSAGIVGELLLIVVAVTAIASYVIPSHDMGLAVRISRFGLLIVSAVFGMIGVAVGTTILIAHLLKLESLGQPYFQPVIPLKPYDLKNVFVRLPLRMMERRPDAAKPKDKKRGKANE